MKAFRLGAVTTLAGAVVMALEILSIRILSPVFGNSVYVWGSVIGVFLAALSIGYAVGGRLADGNPSLPFLGRYLVVAGWFQAILLGWAIPLTEKLAAVFGGPLGPLVVSGLLFGPPTALLATVSPFVIRLAASDLASLGRRTGQLYAMSTAGSLVGTLGCTFGLIPYLGSDAILGLLVGTTGVTAWIAYGRGEPQGSSSPSKLAAVPAVPILAFLLIALWPLSAWLRLDWAENSIERRMTPYQTLEVVESGGQRILLGDGRLQTSIDLESGEPGLLYARHSIAALLFRMPRTMLVLGLGGGSLQSYLRKAVPQVEIDTVEVDSVVVELAERYFDLSPDAQNQIHIEDARRFLSSTGDTWDLIVCDTYVGLSIPFHLTTREFFLRARDRLRPEGSLLVNVAGGIERPFGGALYATVSSVFDQVYVFDVAGSTSSLLVARFQESRIEAGELIDRARDLDLRYRFRPTFVAVASELRAPVAPSAIDVLLDRFAPVDRLLHFDRSP